jgi:hypothetical protein
MHDILRERLMRKIESLPEQQVYQTLDYIEFLESKYGTDAGQETSGLRRFAEAMEDKLRKKSMSPAKVREAFQLLSAADRVLKNVSAAGRKLMEELTPGSEGAPGGDEPSPAEDISPGDEPAPMDELSPGDEPSPANEPSSTDVLSPTDEPALADELPPTDEHSSTDELPPREEPSTADARPLADALPQADELRLTDELPPIDGLPPADVSTEVDE